MTLAIEIGGLTKRYGAVAALDGVDLHVPQGSVFGFLGPNGAGKTTTLRILNGLARATSGSVRVFGHDANEERVREITGYLPDVPGFYPWMTAEELLRFVGGLYRLDSATLDDRVEVLLGLAGLRGVDTRVGGFSRGMKQRLGIAQALMSAPKLLMLDEPTSALDPIGRREVLEMVASLKGRTTVFFSTHILADVERVCDTVAVLDRGRVVVQAPIDDLKRRFGAERLVVDVDPEGPLREALAAEPWVASIDPGPEGGLSVSVTDTETASRRVPQMVAELGLAMRRFESGEVTLEEVFVDLVGQGEVNR